VKVWMGYGSEHSANLVMIGHFADAATAKAVAATIERIERYVRDEINAGRMELGREGGYRFTDQLWSCPDLVDNSVKLPAQPIG